MVNVPGTSIPKLFWSNKGVKVKDRLGNKGIVTFCYNGECTIQWDNDMAGSFTEKQMLESGISRDYSVPVEELPRLLDKFLS